MLGGLQGLSQGSLGVNSRQSLAESCSNVTLLRIVGLEDSLQLQALRLREGFCEGARDSGQSLLVSIQGCCCSKRLLAEGFGSRSTVTSNSQPRFKELYLKPYTAEALTIIVPALLSLARPVSPVLQAGV